MNKDQIDLSEVEILNSSDDVKNWPITTNIKQIDINNNGQRGNTIIYFDRIDGADRWKDFQPSWSAPNELMQYTMWLFLKINGKWFGSGFIQCWYGRNGSGDNPKFYHEDWYYDSGRWQAMHGHKIIEGEQIGFMVTNHDDRNNGSTGNKERSNIVLFTVPVNFDGLITYNEDFSPILTPPIAVKEDLLELIADDLHAIRVILNERL